MKKLILSLSLAIAPLLAFGQANPIQRNAVTTNLIPFVAGSNMVFTTIGSNIIQLNSSADAAVGLRSIVGYYGAKGGIADDTAVFQAAINDVALHGGAILVDPVTNYTVGNLFLSNNVTLKGFSTHMRFLSSASGYMLDGAQYFITNVVLDGLTLDGQEVGFTGGGPNGTSHAAWTYSTPDFTQILRAASGGARSGIHMASTSTNSLILNCVAEGFNDAGYRIYGNNTFPQPQFNTLVFVNNSAVNCWQGVDTVNSSEYITILNFKSNLTGYGMAIESGNVEIIGGMDVQDGVAVAILAGTNPGHGQVFGRTMNHNYIAALMSGVPNGEVFESCLVHGGGEILITNSAGFRWSGGAWPGAGSQRAAYLNADILASGSSCTNNFLYDFGVETQIVPTNVLSAKLPFVGQTFPVDGLFVPIILQTNFWANFFSQGALFGAGLTNLGLSVFQGNVAPEQVGPSAFVFTDPSSTNLTGLPYDSSTDTDDGKFVGVQGNIPVLTKNGGSLVSLSPPALTGAGTIPVAAINGIGPVSLNGIGSTGGITNGGGTNMVSELDVNSTNGVWNISLIAGPNLPMLRATNATGSKSATLDTNMNLTMSGGVNVAGVTNSAGFKLTSGTPGAGKVLQSDAAGNGTWQTAGAGAGTVTSVTFTGDGTVLSSTPSSAVTTSGTVTAALANAGPSNFLAGPLTAAATAPTYRTIAATDLPAIPGTLISNGTINSNKLDAATLALFGASGGSGGAGTIYSQTTRATVANTVTETSLLGAGTGSRVLPANSMTVGQVYTFKVRGFYSTILLPNFDFKIKANSTTLFDTGLVPSFTAASSVSFELQGNITVITTGSSGTVSVDFLEISEAGGQPLVYGNTSTTVVTVDTTIAQTLDCTFSWDTAAPQNTITSSEAFIQTGSGGASGGGTKASLMIYGSGSTAIAVTATGTVRYYPLFPGVPSGSATPASVSPLIRMPASGYITNWYMGDDTGIGAGTNFVVYMAKNGTPSTTMLINMNGGGTTTPFSGSNLVNSVTFSAGDYIHVGYSNNAPGAPANQNLYGSYQVVFQ